jgi:ribose 5-phosphate isomerase B
MKIAVGNDHRGIAVKEHLANMLRDLGNDVQDIGTNTPTSADYPDYALQVAQAVGTRSVERGILICATGHGMCIVANKVHGVRAVNCRDVVDAEMSRLHNDANVLCLSADLLSEDTIDRIVRAWIETKFEGGRHDRRLEKIRNFEALAETKPS